MKRKKLIVLFCLSIAVFIIFVLIYKNNFILWNEIKLIESRYKQSENTYGLKLDIRNCKNKEENYFLYYTIINESKYGFMDKEGHIEVKIDNKWYIPEVTKYGEKVETVFVYGPQNSVETYFDLRMLGLDCLPAGNYRFIKEFERMVEKERSIGSDIVKYWDNTGDKIIIIQEFLVD